MKINWGTGIVIAFVCFISFIIYFVVRSNTDSRADHDLVTEDYYEAELSYQDEIDAETNSRDLEQPVYLRKNEEGLEIIFPEQFKDKGIEGIVSLYRPSNKHLDFDLPFKLSKTHLLIPDNRLLDGRWDLKITWNHEGKSYLHKESLTY
ncbi:FixH family protein [Poritiphilus flavus]|uniref:Cytochrome C oxidase Cbb3 n=1 Tax=Poritiphilus flavus TaxID=2697053 RepID=A0A6L9E716_9FLAO|nr:FixH family protein [Poritiphilus flavus]NAS10480.1 cytochrome C oxidase Cbb3 [Poritiphilus flavus]